MFLFGGACPLLTSSNRPTLSRQPTQQVSSLFSLFFSLFFTCFALRVYCGSSVAVAHLSPQRVGAQVRAQSLGFTMTPGQPVYRLVPLLSCSETSILPYKFLFLPIIPPPRSLPSLSRAQR